MNKIQSLFKQPWISLSSGHRLIWYIVPFQVCGAAIHIASNYLSNRSTYSFKHAVRDFSVGLFDPFCCIKLTSLARNLFRTVDKTNTPSNTTHSNLDERTFKRDYEQLEKFLSETGDRLASQDVTAGLNLNQACQIIMATRNGIINRVNTFIASSEELILKKEVIFLLGQTGAGKSTILCYLRGDQMQYNKDVLGYDSVTDSKKLISHSRTQSCTYLPNIEIINGQIIVDFPGFDDTHGDLACLGMELALKELLKQLPSKILILYPITNTESRFKGIDDLCMQLNRLVQNHTNCTVLGITKYSQCSAHIAIQYIDEEQKNIEEKQKKEIEELQNLEKRLESQIQVINEQLGMDHPKEVKETLENIKQGYINQKEEARHKQEKREDLPLPEREKKIKYSKEILEIEKEIRKHIHLEGQDPIRFDNLLASDNRMDCLNQLSKSSTAVVQPAYNLMAKHERTLNDIFRNYLKNKYCFEKPSTIIFSDYEQLKANILKYGLLATIAPDMEEFFKLPEIKNIRKDFDLEFIAYFLTAYQKGIDCLKLYRLDHILKCFIEHPEVESLSKKLMSLSSRPNGTLTNIYYNFDEELRHLILPWWATMELSSQSSNPVEAIKILDELANITSQKYDQQTQLAVNKCDQEITKLLQQRDHLVQIKNLVALDNSP